MAREELIGLAAMAAGACLLCTAAVMSRRKKAPRRHRQQRGVLCRISGGCFLLLGFLQWCTPQEWMPHVLIGYAVGTVVLLIGLR